jgi:hypothetical protein
MDQRIDTSLAPSSGIAAKRPSAPRLGAKARKELRAAAAALGAAIDALNLIDAEINAMDDGEAQDAHEDDVFTPALRRRKDAEEHFHATTSRLNVGGVILDGRAFFTWGSESDKTSHYCSYSSVHDLATVVHLDA